MISPKDILRELGAGGRLQLVPFYKSVVVYFAAAAAGCGRADGAERAPSAAALAAKCAPVLCLLLAVGLHLRALPALPAHRGEYARRVGAGLALSALGDACLAWPGARALAAGMAAFGAAHLAYVQAFGWRPLRPARGALCLAAAALYVRGVAPGARGPLAALLAPYAALLAVMAWRGAARGGPAARGALMFLLSDALLGYALCGGRLPYRQVLVMSTYYVGQLGIAVSALRTPPPPHIAEDAPGERRTSSAFPIEGLSG